MINGRTIQEVHKKVIKYILNNGEYYENEYGKVWIECHNIHTGLSDPLGVKWNSAYKFITPKTVKNSLLKGLYLNEEYPIHSDIVSVNINDFINIDCVYGNRLRWHFKEDQISDLIERLQQNLTTNKAIAVTYDPKIDRKEDNVSDFILLDCKVRDNKLYTTGIWRSHDIFMDYYQNLFSLQCLIQFIIHHYNKDNKHEINFGNIETLSTSAYIYESDINDAKRYIGF